MENSKIFESTKMEIVNKFEPEFLIKELTKIRIYYPKDSSKKVDLFLFNNEKSKENFVSTRTYLTGHQD